MRSMTGYGQATAANPRYRITVALRSVNHRGLDLALRLPEELRGEEAELRRLLGARLSRGRIDARFDLELLSGRPVRVSLQPGAVEAVERAVAELESRSWLQPGVRLGELLGLPEVLQTEPEPAQWEETDRELLLGAAGAAADRLLAVREAEGRELAAVLADRLRAIEGLLPGLAARRDAVRSEIFGRLRQRLDELLQAEAMPEERILQEAALVADRGDVAEELDRLGSHLAHFREVMEETRPVGKKLDFIAQEIMRELNTLGAKCRDAAMSRQVVDAKVLCEQLREQLQNVE